MYTRGPTATSNGNTHQFYDVISLKAPASITSLGQLYRSPKNETDIKTESKRYSIQKPPMPIRKQFSTQKQSHPVASKLTSKPITLTEGNRVSLDQIATMQDYMSLVSQVEQAVHDLKKQHPLVPTLDLSQQQQRVHTQSSANEATKRNYIEDLLSPLDSSTQQKLDNHFVKETRA